MQNNLAQVFKVWSQSANPPTISLLNNQGEPVGALYLDKLKDKTYSILETNTSERYFLYIEGVGIYFTSYRKINGGL